MKRVLLFMFLLCLAFSQEDRVARLRTGNRLSTPNFYKKIGAPEKTNLLFSVFSATTALLFLFSGCNGNTAQEILSALQLKLTSRELIESQTKILLEQLTSTALTFDIANGLFVETNYKIKDSFLETAENIFRALAQNVEFSNNVNAAKLINDYVANVTHEKIKDLVDKNSIGQATKLVLVNALYFQGNWTIPFSNKKKQEFFYITPNEKKEINYMLLESKLLNYTYCDFLKAYFVRLCIKGGDASMVIVVPKDRFGLQNIEKNPEAIFKSPNMTEEIITLKLPKFTIRSSFELIPALKKLGIVDAFGGKANLSGIADDSIFVTDIKQKTYIKVDNYGIEAASATAINVGRSAIIDANIEITADHPFFLYIENNGFILFFGKVYDPTKED